MKIALKIIFASSIILWLLKSGKLDFSLIPQVLQNGHSWLFAIGLMIIQDIISAFRWRMILNISSNQKLRIFDIIKITWIGLFFNNFLPGAVTGDFIKLVYIRDLNKDLSKTYLVTTVFIDRILGLIGLLCILGITSLFYYNDVTSLGPQMSKLVHFNLFLFLGAIFFIISLFAPKKFQKLILNLSEKIPIIGSRITKTFKQFWIIGGSKSVVIQSVLISLFLQFTNCLAFYILSQPFYGTALPLGYILSLIPIGFIAIAIPISPAGIGVGHVVFDQLFELIGVHGGANYFNLYFICLVLANSLGVIPYIYSGKRHKLSGTQEFEDFST